MSALAVDFTPHSAPVPGPASLWRVLSRFGPHTPLAAMFAVGLLVLSASRIALMLWQWDRVAAGGVWIDMLVQGVRVDIIQLGLLGVPLVLLAPILATVLT